MNEETYARKWTLITAGLLLLMSLSGIFVVPIEPITKNSDDSLSEEQVRALEELPASAKVSGRNDSSSSRAVEAGGPSVDYGYGIAIDSDGNAYVTGKFHETATFGSTNLTSSGGEDIFIAKLSSSGSWQWAVNAGGPSYDAGYAIAIDSDSNAYVTGRFAGIVSFGNTSLTGGDVTDIFIAKLSSSGYWQWAVKAGGSNLDEGRAIAVDSDSNAYVTGRFYGTATFGSISLTGPDYYHSMFIAKLSSSGSWQWAVNTENNLGVMANGIAANSSGNAYVTGSFEGTVTFGSTSLTAANQSRATFIAKLSSSGSWEWAVKVNCSSQYNGIAVDSSDNAYVTGGFVGTTAFGSTTLTSSGYSDIFVAKLSSSGSWQWAVMAGSSSNNDQGSGIAVDSSGNAYVTGYFAVYEETTATFGNTSLTSSGHEDIFIAKLSSSGSWQWAVKAGGSEWDQGMGIAVDSIGNAYVTGLFSETATFGSTNLTSSGHEDIFIANLNSSSSWYDSDMDGVNNAVDNCPYGATDWDSNTSTDYDSDGCRDLDEDQDNDNDGLLDDDDACPSGTIGPHSLGQDRDNDGCNDLTEDDDDDNDGWLDDEDNCPSLSNQNQNDTDGDGIGDLCDSDDDNDGFLDEEDDCPYTSGISTEGEIGCPDSDDDGVIDLNDLCPNTIFYLDTVNEFGCALNEIDSDEDGIKDIWDLCEGHPDEVDIDENGIPDGCDDSDGDGIVDSLDICADGDDNDDSDQDGIPDACEITNPEPVNETNMTDEENKEASENTSLDDINLLEIVFPVLLIISAIIFTVYIIRRKKIKNHIDLQNDPVETYTRKMVELGYDENAARQYAEQYYATYYSQMKE